MRRSAGAEATPPSGELELIARQIDQGVALVREGRIAWASPRLVELVSCADGMELIGQSLTDWLDDEGRGVCSGHDPEGRVCELRDESGRLTSRFRSRCVGRTRGEGGESEIWMFEAWPLESGDAGARDAVRELDRELDSLRRMATARARERDELVAHFSHEMRTPLTIISGYGKLLLSGRAGDLSEEQRRCLEESSLGCQKLNRFVDHLLESFWEDADGFALDRRAGNLADSITGVVSFMRPLLEERRLGIAIDIDDSLPEASLDYARIEQVLTNLLENAIRFTKSSSTIDLTAHVVTGPIRSVGHEHGTELTFGADAHRADEGESGAGHGSRERGESGESSGRASDTQRWIEVAIVDDGPGVALEDRERIFDAFVRVMQSGDPVESEGSPASGGVGLGLSICRRIIAAHDGRIAVSDVPGRGSRFEFTIPLAELNCGGES